ncbi:MAG: flagellar hook-length control protein FliK [Clostridiales bacterium]|nr:flagellar hook-length control protein FliK [Clostridiales bacterium]
MVNLDILNQLKINIQNTDLKSNSSKISNNEIKDKNSFNDLLNKEVNERGIKFKSEKAVVSREKNELKQDTVEKEIVVDKKSLEEVIEKVVKVIDENFDEEEVDLKSISDVLILLSNLLYNDNSINENSYNNLIISDSNCLDINVENDNKSFITNFDINGESIFNDNNQIIDNGIEGILNELFYGNERNSAVLNDAINIAANLDKKNSNLNEATSIIDNLEIIKGLLIEALENNNSLEEDAAFNLKVDNLNDKLIEIVNSLSQEDITSMVNSMNKDEKTELMKALTSIKNNEEASKFDNSHELMSPISIRIASNNEANEDGYEFNLKDEIAEEDKLLLKILGEDDKNSFASLLASVNKSIQNPSEIIVEPKGIYRHTFNSDIIQSVKYMIKNNMEELSIKIYPKELGELTIKIISEEGIMKAELRATSKETYNLLNANLQEIRNNLQEQNIKIQEVSINIYNEDTTFFSGEKQNSSSQNKKSDNKVTGIYSEGELEEEIDLQIMDNNLNILA